MAALCFDLTQGLSAGQRVITFEDLNPGQANVVVQNGYEGLLWDHFAVLDGSLQSTSTGYRSGIVSSNNVAFNLSGLAATFGSGDLFDLHSAFLTAAFVDDLLVRVRGYDGTNLTYDTSHLLSISTPTFIELNYLGINRATFSTTSDQIFVLEDLMITLPSLPANNFQHVDIPNIGHRFSTGGPSGSKVVRNFLIDQSGTSGAGVLEPVRASFDTNKHFSLTLSAPSGQRFLIQPPAENPVRFSGSLTWAYTFPGMGPSAPGVDPGELQVTFSQPLGTVPDFSASISTLSDFHASFELYVQSALFTNELSFKSIILTATANSGYSNSGALPYLPGDSSALRISYELDSSETNDPGAFVFLIPELLPALDLALAPNGDIIITFNGTLEQADNPIGPFEDVVGNPSGVYTITEPVTNLQQFFRAKME